MKLQVLIRRFLLPSPIVTLLAYLRFKAYVSMRAEVELSPLLRLGRKTRVSSFSKVKASHGELTIGDRTSIATGVFISAGEKGTHIGSDCLIGPNCTIISGTFRYGQLDKSFEEQGHDSKGTSIGNNVMLGAGTAVLDGAEIGSGVVIGANSVETGRIPDNVVAKGNPAKVVFERR